MGTPENKPAKRRTRPYTASEERHRAQMVQAMEELVAIAWDNAEVIRDFVCALLCVGVIPYNCQLDKWRHGDE